MFLVRPVSNIESFDMYKKNTAFRLSQQFLKDNFISLRKTNILIICIILAYIQACHHCALVNYNLNIQEQILIAFDNLIKTKSQISHYYLKILKQNQQQNTIFS